MAKPESVIFLNEVEDKSSILSRVKESLQPPCILCQKAAPYLCSKCSKPYCSVECYRNHNKSSCSEEFYKESAQKFLKGKKPSKEQASKMKKILEEQRMDREEDMQTDEADVKRALENKPVWLEESSAEQLLSRLQEGELDLEDLSHEQQQMFMRFIREEAPTLVGDYKPLWTVGEGVLSFDVAETDADVDQISKAEDAKGNVTRDLSQLWERESYDLEDGLDLSELKQIRRAFHRRVRSLPRLSVIAAMDEPRRRGMSLNVLNILTASAFVFRKFHGDLANSFEEICALLLQLAPCLRNDWKQWYTSAAEAFRTDLLKTVLGVKQHRLVSGLLEDVSQLLSDRFFVCEQLYLIYDCFLREFEASTDKTRKQASNATVQKLLFFITFVRDNRELHEKSLRAQVEEHRKKLQSAEDMLKDGLRS